MKNIYKIAGTIEGKMFVVKVNLQVNLNNMELIENENMWDSLAKDLDKNIKELRLARNLCLGNAEAIRESKKSA